MLFRALAFALCFATTTARAQHVLHEFVGSGPQAALGGAAASIGDLDLDGTNDFVLCTLDELGTPNVVEIVSGSTFATLHTFSDLESGFGHTLAGMGDLDGDGRPDVAIGDPDWGGEIGQVFFYSGATGALLYSLVGSAQDDRFGFSIASVGDVDGDGRADLIIGAPQWFTTSSGYARVVSGANGATLWTFTGTSLGDLLGWSVSSAGDVDHDGRADFLVGARQTPFGPGYANVYSSATGHLSFTLVGGPFAQTFAASVACAGDVDHDGTPDEIVGGDLSDPDGTKPGMAFVFSGVDGHELFHLTGGWPLGWFGAVVAGVGDVDADGFDDIAVGALRDGAAGPDSGVVRVYSGRTQAVISAFHGRAGENLAGPLVDVGDLDHDGFPDLLIGSLQAVPYPQYPGRAHVISTHDGPAAFCSAAPNSSGGAAEIETFGTLDVSSNDLVLYAHGAPPGRAGIFVYGTAATAVPFGDGTRCAGGQLFALGPASAIDAAGSVQRPIDLNAPPANQGPGAIAPGSTRYFQFFFRDPLLPAGQGFNASNALRATFGP
jgi:hypothetical protein